MRRILLAVLMVLMLCTFAQAEVLKAIGKTGDAAVTTSGPGYLRGIIVNTDGTNSVTITAYDNASAASGSKLFSPVVVTTSASDRVRTITFGDFDCNYVNGIFVDVTTSGTVTYDVYFQKR